MHNLQFVLALLGISMLGANMTNAEESKTVTHVIEITGFKFSPASVRVKSGDTLTWINKDIAPHTATASNLSFNTGELKLNESRSITVTSDQTISYFCQFHPAMIAVLIFD